MITPHPPRTSKAKRDQRKRQRDRLRDEVAKRDHALTALRADRDRLRRAIAEHRTATHHTEMVRGDSPEGRAAAIADAKRAADQQLWNTVSS